MRRFIADANIGMRILVGDRDIAAAETPEKAEMLRAMYEDTRALLTQVSDGKVTLYFPDAVVEEMIFVLSKVYNLDREYISRKILTLLEADNIESTDTIRRALSQYATTNLDIVDIKLGVLSKELGSPVLTWDKGFSKLNFEYYSPRDIIDTEDPEEES
jgi:Predicted nucleic-acid-binding protein, contains PIN domain